jgi:hypothetical protein
VEQVGSVRRRAHPRSSLVDLDVLKPAGRALGRAQAKASESAFIETLGLLPRDVGSLEMAHWLKGAGLLMMGLAGHGAGPNIAPGVDVLD